MTYVIAEPCINVKDKACVEVCPVDCIHGEDADPQLYINPQECIDCGACEPECPVEAIFEESALPAEWKQFTEINAKYFA
jgi:ferredoxin